MTTALSTNATPARGLALQTMSDAMQFAAMVAKSDFAPKDFKGKPESCLLAIQHGAEIGLSPMQSLQNIACINGRPAIWGDAALALCLANPVCDGIHETIEGDGDNMVAVCKTSRRGKDANVVGRFSVADAKRAGLWGKSGPWTQYPRRMLQLRARGFALRDAFPDVLKGLVTAEEAQDYPATEPAREPVVIRPKFHEPDIRTTPDDVAEVRTGRVVLNPKSKPEVARTVAERARLAIASCPSVDKLDDARRKLDLRLAEGVITAEEHRELAGMTLERAEILMAGEDRDQEHFDADEVQAEANS